MIQTEIHQLIHVGDRLPNAEIRRLLQALYDKYNIKRKAKATDITFFGFVTQRAVISVDGKRKEGIKIIHE